MLLGDAGPQAGRRCRATAGRQAGRCCWATLVRRRVDAAGGGWSGRPVGAAGGGWSAGGLYCCGGWSASRSALLAECPGIPGPSAGDEPSRSRREGSPMPGPEQKVRSAGRGAPGAPPSRRAEQADIAGDRLPVATVATVGRRWRRSAAGGDGRPPVATVDCRSRWLVPSVVWTPGVVADAGCGGWMSRLAPVAATGRPGSADVPAVGAGDDRIGRSGTGSNGL